MKMVTKPALLAVCAVGVGACAAWARHVERLVVMRAEAVPLSEAVSESAPEGGAALVAAPAPRRAVETLLKSLDDAQRTRAVFPFDAEERMNWHFVPKDRKGLRFDSLDARQQGLFLGVLKECLGASGLKKVETVRSLENVLKEIEKGTGPTRDTGLYYLTVFGTPTDKGAWGLRYEGHHVSLSWVFVGGKVVCSSPQFVGANPAEVRIEGPYRGLRAMAAEEDRARDFLAALKPEQKAVAVSPEKAPADILTGAKVRIERFEDGCIAYSALDEGQKALLLALITAHAEVQSPAVAKERLDRARKSDLNAVRFLWIGGTERGQGHYYRVQGPTFLIEYDNTQNDANHVHAVWRDFRGDFGADTLAEHYRQSHGASAE